MPLRTPKAPHHLMTQSRDQVWPPINQPANQIQLVGKYKYLILCWVHVKVDKIHESGLAFQSNPDTKLKLKRSLQLIFMIVIETAVESEVRKSCEGWRLARREV